VGIDPGTAKYGLPVQNGWFKTSLAHNTLVVGEENQNRTEGKCLALGQTEGVDFVVADAGPIYDGLRFTRSVALVDENLLVFVDQVVAEDERAMDLVYHTRGAWVDVPDGEPWEAPDKPGYRYLRDATARSTSKGLVLGTQVSEGWRTTVTLAGGDPTEVVTATGIGRHLEDRVPAMVLRRRAAQTAYAWCTSLDAAEVQLVWLGVTDASGEALPRSVAAALAVTSSGGRRVLAVNPDGRALRVRMPDGSAWATSAVFEVR